MSSTVFVRERRKIEKGEKKPRYRIVGVSGGDLKICVNHIRKKELEQICNATGAKLVYLDAGEGTGDGGGKQKP